MARNRKNESTVIRFVPAIKALLLCALLGLSSVGYVLQKHKIQDLGHLISQREALRDKLRWQNQMNQARLEELLSPSNLQARLHLQNSPLALPQPAQMIWLDEPTLTTNSQQTASLMVLGNETTQSANR